MRWLAIGSVALGLLSGARAGFGSTALPMGDCRSSCYEAKSSAYQRCRSIPVTDRAGRQRCFRRADEQLRRCLSHCR